MSFLHLDNVSCRRGGRIVFHGVTVRLDAGCALMLRGKNGAGKSSLLRVMAGLTPPASGTVHRPEGGIAWLGHLDAVKPALTVQENLTHWGLTTHSESLARFGLEALAELPARFLSAGQRRRLALARVAASGRHLWLLDEPETALDADSRVQLVASVAAHLAGGGMAVIASHGMATLAGAAELDLCG